MILTETNITFPLSSIKPLEGVSGYREFCLDETKKVLSHSSVTRSKSPVGKRPLLPWGKVDGLSYLQCPATGSLFLEKVAKNKEWGALLNKVSAQRQSPNEFLKNVAGTRASHVYIPKLEWIESVMRMQGVNNPNILEITTPPSKFTSLLKSSRSFKSIETIKEMDLISSESKIENQFDVVVMLESLDRVNDPQKLMEQVYSATKSGGLIFVTGLVSSGFDITALGTKNLYLYPTDRTNCFSLKGLTVLLSQNNFEFVEVSTPGVLDLEIVKGHVARFPHIKLSPFEKNIIKASEPAQTAFQTFLQQSGMSSFARIVGRKI